MKTQEILVDQDDVHINCPNCENGECQPIDQQRHHLQTFDLLEWCTVEDKNKPEESILKCLSCEKKFKMIWDYKDD